MTKRTAFIVHGRFYAFDLMREFCRQGAAVTLFTNYPRRIAARFGVPPAAVDNNVTHGVVTRVLQKLGSMLETLPCEVMLHRWFGRWAARAVCRGDYQVVRCFSGVAEEVFAHSQCQSKLKVLERASSHIKIQHELLEQEEHRTGIPVSKPSVWMIDREVREYELADKIVVLSSFALKSFVQMGVSESKLWLVPLAVENDHFRADEAALSARNARLAGAQPLRVLTTGAFSLRKGAFDYGEIVRSCGDEFEFRWVGVVTPETRTLAASLSARVDFVPSVPQYELNRHYAWADIYIFPTIEDGFAAVLAQAQASALPIIATTNCSAPDILIEGETGWILPIRTPAAFIERLRWCAVNRKKLVDMGRACRDRYQPKDWSAVALHFSSLIQ